MHRRQEPVLGADVSQHLYIEQTRELETPIALAGADAPRKALGGIAHLQIVGVEVQGLVGVNVEGNRVVRGAGVVERFDGDLARVGRMVHDPDEALTPDIRGGRHERNGVAGFGRAVEVRHDVPHVVDGPGGAHRTIQLYRPFLALDTRGIEAHLLVAQLQVGVGKHELLYAICITLIFTLCECRHNCMATL